MAWYRNHYHCEGCAWSWSDEWSCCCDDECPSCSRDFTPEVSEDLSIVCLKKAGDAVEILASPPSAGHSPDYQMIALAFDEKQAKVIADCLNTHLDLEEFFK